ncbi:uncharacterized protein RB166_010602 [Leptodactylus fuscus]|uniref:uncharacterized protein LOC142195756 n=1 Tax=Leptodactylus fuscus TaxID=238119 RepID=UPI003F4E78C0
MRRFSGLHIAASKNMEASLTCAVCLGIFRDPVTLPRCSHNFCKLCVRECANPYDGPDLWPPPPLRPPRYENLSCPLCRKVSSLAGGLHALPVNTTLAEVVRLLPLTKKDKAIQTVEATCGDQDPINRDSDKSYCEEHPEFKLELFCRNCEQACCGKCVSLHHQGIFHNVNLLDIIFQEERLVFFNSLKTLREVHERLTKEILDDERKCESILKANEDAVTAAFDEVQKALDLKKQQLLDLVKQQQDKSIKYCQVQKATKAHHKTTAESILQACEDIVDDNEPRSFLQVACGLNKRMKSNLELLEFCADRNEDLLKVLPQCVEVQAVLDAVSALKATSSSKDLNKPNGSISFTSISRTWNRGMTTNETFSPVQDQEIIYLQGQMLKMSIRFVCITKMAEYQHLSYEELRLKYYEPSIVQESGAVSAPESPFVCNVNNFTFGVSREKSTKMKRQDWGRPVYGKKDVLKLKPAKIDFGRMEQKDRLFACPLEGPSSSSGDMNTSLTSAMEVEKPEKFCEGVSNKALFQNFCLGKSEYATMKKTGRNEKYCKKMKSTSCLPTFLNTGPFGSTSAMAERSANMFLCNTEENMSVNSSSSSEEFYDASCNVDPDVEQPCEQSNSQNSTNDHEFSSLQGSPH